jgi:hypothetical protein
MKYNRWVLLYVGCLAVIIVTTYLGISVWLRTPATVINTTKKLDWIGPKTTPLPTLKAYAPPRDSMKNTAQDPSTYVKLVDSPAPESKVNGDVYIVRLETSTPLRLVNGALRGTGFLLSDPKRTPIPFAISGPNNKFILGYFTSGAFEDMANQVSTVGPEVITGKVPIGTWIQLRLTTEKYSADDQKAITSLLDHARQGQVQTPNFVLEAYAIELVKK